MSKPLQKITPFLWFDNRAEEAVKSYTSVLRNSKVEALVRHGEAGPKGSVMTVTFQLAGQQFVVLIGWASLQIHPRPYRLSSTAKRRKNWTSCGRSYLKAEQR